MGSSLSALVRAGRALDETPTAQRVGVFGAPYVEAIDEIRRRVPRGGAYFLATTAGNPSERSSSEEARLWVRFDLAPRRALDLGPIEDFATADGDTRPLHLRAGGARWAVLVPAPPGPPVLLSRAELQKRLSSDKP